MPLTIDKVGGSLQGLLAGGPGPLRPHWHDGRRHALIFGGGHAVRTLRGRHARGEIDDVQAHWLAVAVMADNAARYARRWRLPLVDGLRPPRRPLAVIDVRPVLLGDAGRTLPIGWHVTSDSIAAWWARRLDARLRLFKRAPPPAGDWHAAAAAGVVDAFFPTVAPAEVEWVRIDAVDPHSQGR